MESEATIKPDKFRGLNAAIQSVRTESALNPLLWLTGLTLFSAVGANLASGELKWWMFGLAALCVFCSLGAYFYFMIKDPNRLHSEHYQLERHKLDLMLDDRFNNKVVTIDVTPTANTISDRTK